MHVRNLGLSWPFMPLLIIYLSYTSVESHALWLYKNFVLMRYCKRQLWMEQQGMVDAYITFIFSPQVHAPLPHATSHIKHKFRYIIIKNFQDGNRIALNQKQCSSEYRALCDNTGHMPIKPALLKYQNFMWNAVITKMNQLFWTFSEPLLCLYASESPKVIETLAFAIFRRQTYKTSGGSSYSLLNFLALPLCIPGMTTDWFMLIKHPRDLWMYHPSVNVVMDNEKHDWLPTSSNFCTAYQ